MRTLEISMHRKFTFWIIFCLALLPLAACSVPTASLSDSTVTPGAAAQAGGGAAGGVGSQPGSLTATPSPQPSPSPSASPTRSPTPTPTVTPSATPDRPSPYLVKQIETLGGETISGFACNTRQPFDVTYVTPKVTFVTHYYPVNDTQGNWNYAYTLSSAGESHDAKGSYILQPTDQPGILLLKMSGSDHVVFKGFDGNIPSRYQFDLVEASVPTCH